MSTHANQAKKGGPSAPDKEEIMGANPTYKSHVQKDAQNGSSTKPAGSGKIEKVEGEGSIPHDVAEEDRETATGSGHYIPAK
jgi:hypothetical protein